MSRSIRPKNAREQGSAYIVALLVLLVLTVLGLSLALVTQSELQIGANERTIHRTFYGADSGMAVAVARLIVSGDTDSLNKFEIKDPDPNPLNLRTRVDACVPIIVDVCHADLSSINLQGGSGSTYKKLSFGITSEAMRLAGSHADADKAPLGRRTVSMIADLSPQSDDTKKATGSANEECVNRMKL